MDEDEFDFEPVPIPSRRFRPIDLVIYVLDCVEEFIGGFNRMLMSHANWKNDRQRFADAARADIEAIVGGA